MSIEVKVPALPESVSDATVVAWHKQKGDTIRRDESLVDLETDKVVLEVPAPADGVLTEIYFKEGDVVEADALLARLKEQSPVEAQEKNNGPVKAQEKPAQVDIQLDRVITPSARKMIAEYQLKAEDIPGTGKGGRVLKEDVIAYRQRQANAEPETADAEQAPPVSAAPPADSADARIEKRVPMTRLRARIAERLLEAQHNAAILTTFNEVNMQPVMDLRSKYKDTFEKKYGVKLGFMSFFIKASIEALKRFPAVNASIDGNDIVYHGYFDIGVAVASPRGLVVPVLRDADQMSFAELETGIADFVDKAKNNRLDIADITGGTFSLTNGGVFGSMLSTPILNPPQSAILGMHKIQPRAVVENNELVARPMMYLALSYDHRIIDGAEAVQFLVTIKETLEEPARILMGI